METGAENEVGVTKRDGQSGAAKFEPLEYDGECFTVQTVQGGAPLAEMFTRYDFPCIGDDEEKQEAVDADAERYGHLFAAAPELLQALRDVLATGLNGGNNVRLAFIAASQKALGPEDLERAEKSEQALQRAYAAIAKATPPPRPSDSDT